jgi:hypothetical protein
MEFAYLEAATDDASGSEASDGEASPRGGGEGGNDGVASSVPAASAASAAAGALRGWRAWGGGALSALSSLQLDSVQKLATEALATVRRDVGEFSEALTADAAELAAAGAAAADEALPELRATAAGLQEKLEVVGGGLETAGASLLANIAQARAPDARRAVLRRRTQRNHLRRRCAKSKALGLCAACTRRKKALTGRPRAVCALLPARAGSRRHHRRE